MGSHDVKPENQPIDTGTISREKTRDDLDAKTDTELLILILIELRRLNGSI